MNQSNWDEYESDSNTIGQFQSNENVLVGLKPTLFGSKSVLGLSFLLLGLLIELILLLTRPSSSAPTVEELTAYADRVQNVAFLLIFLNMTGIVLIMSDVKSLTAELGIRIDQHNSNLVVLAEKINKK